MTETDTRIDFDTWDWPEIHHFLRLLAERAGEYAGIPTPINGYALRLEDRYPNRIQAQVALDLTGDGNTRDIGFSVGLEPLTSDEPAEFSFSCTSKQIESWVRNSWYSRRRNADVYLIQEGDKVRASVEPRSAEMDRLAYQVHTMDVAQAWDLDCELAAVRKLHGLLTPHLFAMYCLTGSFLEVSPRSGVTYLLRRCRPTVAMASDPDPAKPIRFLAALCMHPLGYYTGTWAGAMVPTDDVLAHLLMIRGDEHLLWRRANQHPAYAPEAAL